MTKQELLSQMVNAKNNYILGLAASSLLANDSTYPILKKSSCSFGQYTIDFTQVAILLQNANDKEIALKEFVTMFLRMLIKEGFELVKSYCETSNQLSALKKQSWYQFARIIRNCVSHNFKFEFTSYDIGLLPVSWNGCTINQSMNNKFLQLQFFGYQEVWGIYQDFMDFVQNDLN